MVNQLQQYASRVGAYVGVPDSKHKRRGPELIAPALPPTLPLHLDRKNETASKRGGFGKEISACRLCGKSAFGFCGDLANLFAQSSSLAFQLGSGLGNCLNSFPTIGLDSTLQVADYFFYGFHLDTSLFLSEKIASGYDFIISKISHQ